MRFHLATLLSPFLALPLFAQAPDAPDEKACLEVVKKIETAVQAADNEAYDAELNLRSMLENVLKNVEAEESFKKEFIDGATGTSLGAQLCQQMQNGAKFRFLRLHTVSGRTCALFRLINAAGGVNYHDYVLEKDGDAARATDLFVYMMGEAISRTFKREFLKAVAVQTKGAGNLKGWEKDYAEAQPKIKEMQEAIAANKPKKAMKAYRELPQTVQDDKLIMVQRVAAALKAGDDEYTAALADWEKLFPGDPSMDLMQIDAFAMKGDYQKAAEAAERLGKTIGGDPFLDAMRGALFLQAEKFDDAQKCAEKSAADEKGLTLSHFVLLKVGLHKKDNSLVAAELTALEKECAVPVGDLESEADFADFVKSEEYTKWKEGRK